VDDARCSTRSSVDGTVTVDTNDRSSDMSNGSPPSDVAAAEDGNPVAPGANDLGSEMSTSMAFFNADTSILGCSRKCSSFHVKTNFFDTKILLVFRRSSLGFSRHCGLLPPLKHLSMMTRETAEHAATVLMCNVAHW